MTEMQKLMVALSAWGIPYETTLDDLPNTSSAIHLYYPTQENFKCSIISHKWSYGGQNGLLEIMGLVDTDEVGDDVEGYLYAAEVLRRIDEDYSRTKED